MHVVFCRRKGSNNIIMDQVKLSVRLGKVSCGCNSVPVHLWMLALDEWSAYLRTSALILCLPKRSLKWWAAEWLECLDETLSARCWIPDAIDLVHHESPFPCLVAIKPASLLKATEAEGPCGKDQRGEDTMFHLENSLLVCSPFLSFVSVVSMWNWWMMRCWMGQRSWRL